MTYRDLHPKDAHSALQSDTPTVILDVRTAYEFAMHRVDGAVLIPIQELEQRVDELDPNASYVVFCEHGMRSVAACEYLSHLGFRSLTNVVGGMAAWVAEGLPHVRG